VSILLVEPPSAHDSLCVQVERATGWPVIHVHSFPEALQSLAVNGANARIAAFTLDDSGDEAFRFMKATAKISAVRGTERPLFLALSHASQPPEVAVRLEKLGAQLLLRKYPEQIVEAIKKLQCQSRTTKQVPTILVQRSGGHISAVKAKYRASSEELVIGPRLRALVGYFVVHPKTQSSTDMLADALGISRQSVKEYLLRLRLAYDRVRPKLGTVLRGKDVFWTRKAPGGHVHGLKASAEIEDTEEFYDAGAELAPSVFCRVCHEKATRSEATLTHLGWVCVGCCRELQDSREL
jgi:hypothetical protein